MGVGWRRFTERLHQGAPVRGSGGLQPTSNACCSTMLQEATAFTSQLRKCERAIRSMSAANADAASTIKLVMSAPLPVRWEDTAAAAAGSMPSLQSIGGPAFQPEQMGRALQEAGHKTETEVLAPLARWQEVYQQLGARFRDLEGLRLEVDSRRRTVAELSQKVDGMRARLGKGGDAKQEAALQECVKKLQRKEGKLAVAAQSFESQERLLHRDLSTLIRDAEWLRHYAAAAMRLQGHALLEAASAFGPLPPSGLPPAFELAARAGAVPVAGSLGEGMGREGMGREGMGREGMGREGMGREASGDLPAGTPLSVPSAHSRGPSGGSYGELHPTTPAAPAAAPPMARYPVMAVELGPGEH